MGFAADVAADDSQHVGHGLHVLEVRDIRYFGDAVGEECRSHYGEHGVLCTGNFNFAIERLFNLRYNKLVHNKTA